MRSGNHKLNEQRIIKKFAIFPIAINGEIRWLEYVEYMEEWYAPGGVWGWYKQKFLN